MASSVTADAVPPSPKVEGLDSKQEVNKEVKSVEFLPQEVKSEEVKQIGARKANRRKPRKG